MSASVFPARAGMSPLTLNTSTAGACVPRASGDEPIKAAEGADTMKCSPRERG